MVFLLSCVFLVTKQFQEYVDPEQGEEKKKIGTEEEDAVLPLDPNVLTDNLGFPIVVVCTKVGNHQNVFDEEYVQLHYDCVSFL